MTVESIRVRHSHTSVLVYYWDIIEVAACDIGTTEIDVEEDAGPSSGTAIINELVTPAPDGTETEFETRYPYLPNTLVVFVDGVAIASSEVDETDSGLGAFTLTWAPDADERIEARYTVY